MSNLNPEQQYQTIPEMLDFNVKQIMKNYYFCLPGIVQSFDAKTRRIVAKVAIKKLVQNGTLEYALLHDVPVLFPCSKQYSVYFPLDQGDTVLLHFSQRGIQDFKETYEESNPTPTSFFSLTDAIATPSFGNLTQNVVDEEALVLQTNDQSSYISIKDGEININASVVKINGVVQVDDLEIGGVKLNSAHTHGGVSSGNDNTLPPNL